jgi:uncharacterized membrane protein YgcG
VPTFVPPVVQFNNTLHRVDAEGEKVPICSSMVECFWYVMHKGNILASGVIPEDVSNGLSYNVEEDNTAVWVALFDFSFFVIVIILLFNFVFGILIDTFARLREEHGVEEDQADNVCFICSKPKSDWLTLRAFDHHRVEEHSLLDYVYFMLHISSKRKNDMNGLDTFVSEMIAAGDVHWFPISKSLAQKDFEDDESIETVMQQVKSQGDQMAAIGDMLSGMRVDAQARRESDQLALKGLEAGVRELRERMATAATAAEERERKSGNKGGEREGRTPGAESGGRGGGGGSSSTRVPGAASELHEL